jgi:hypothetical protein
VSWDGLRTFSFGPSQFHGYGSWLVCEVPAAKQQASRQVAANKALTALAELPGMGASLRDVNRISMASPSRGFHSHLIMARPAEVANIHPMTYGFIWCFHPPASGVSGGSLRNVRSAREARNIWQPTTTWHVLGRPILFPRGLRFLRFPRPRPPSERAHTQRGCSEFALPNQILHPTTSFFTPTSSPSASKPRRILSHRCRLLILLFPNIRLQFLLSQNGSLKARIISH